jgi:hypothetical protein
LDLTTATGGDAERLRAHFKALRRRIEREFGFERLEYFALDTIEGNGVLHTVLAYQGTRSFYIPHQWLAAEWQRIHGAYIVYVQAMGNTRKDQKQVAKYIATQYLADQKGAAVRLSYSWWRSKVALAKAWETLKKHYRETYMEDGNDGTRRGRWHVHYTISIAELVAAWEKLLEHGWARLRDDVWVIARRDCVLVNPACAMPTR